MKISTIPMDENEHASRRTELNRADQSMFLGDGRFILNTFIWKTILQIQDIIRGVLDEHFSEIGMFFDMEDSSDVDSHFIKKLVEAYGEPQAVYYFQSKSIEAKKYSFIPSNVSQQLSLYSISKKVEEINKQCHRIQKDFLEIFHQIDLPIGSDLRLLPARDKHSEFFECWGAIVGEIHPIEVEDYYVVKGNINISQIIDSFIWVNYFPHGFYLPENVAPFEYAIVNDDLQEQNDKAKLLHKKLSKLGVRVLWDNRDISYDEKLEFISKLGINRVILLDGTTYEGDSEEDFTFKILYRISSKVTTFSLKKFLRLFKRSNLMK